MTDVQYTLVGTEDGSNISVFVSGSAPQVAHSSHPNFQKILEKVLAGDPTVIDLFDVGQTAVNYFDRVGERVTYANGKLYFDGDEINNTLTKQILRTLEDGADDFNPLVLFMEKVQNNPSEHSRDQLFDWLDAHDFTINAAGEIVGYKGVRVDGNGDFWSINSGRAIVDGAVFTGTIPNWVGANVEMPRSEVQFDPGRECSTGLHVGTWEYAKGFSRGAVLEVVVDPRDVVSVPTNSGAQKMRVCRYYVSKVIDTPHALAVVYDMESYRDHAGWGEIEDDDCQCPDFCEGVC